MWKSYLKLLRVDHYIKNFIIFLPLLFCDKFCLSYFIRSCSLFLSFCLISSAIYIINDISDIKYDTNHPIKSLRPIASGTINKKNALILMFICLFFSLFLAIVSGGNVYLLTLCYFILNIAYSLLLKYTAIIDICCIALGFVLRVLSGYVLISVHPSLYLLLLTFVIAILLILEKRKYEIMNFNNYSKKNYKFYDINMINKLIKIFVLLSVIVYLIFIFENISLHSSKISVAILSIICFVIAFLRFEKLSNTNIYSKDFITVVLEDKYLIFCFTLFLITLLYIFSI